MFLANHALAAFSGACSEGIAKRPVTPDGCCSKLILPCSARPGNSDSCCEQGFNTTELVNNCGPGACDVFFGPGPFDTCLPLIDGSEAELPNGVDDNCDGIGIGDEFCDGIDNDGDGLIDEDQGSCVQRFLFVPFCWQGNDPSALQAATSRWVNFLEDKSLIVGCGHDHAARGRKIWSENAPLSLIGCPSATTLSDLLAATRAAGVDVRNFDVVSFATNMLSPDGCVAGLTSGDGLVSMETGGATPAYPGEYVVFAHEFGHIIGLGEEYTEQFGTPNPVTAQLGCDPSTCCVHPHACTWLDGKRCLGNESSNPAGWSWQFGQDGSPILTSPTGGQTPGTFPGFFGDGSRCIMSNASALGWDIASDPATGQGSHRGWCAACLNQYTVTGPKCIDVFAGAPRRLEASGHVDGQGQIFLSYMDVRDGRTGAGSPPQGGETTIEARDSAGSLIAAFAPKLAHAQPVELPTSTPIPFWLRVPVGSGTVAPVTFTSFRAGVRISQVTGGGQPAVPVTTDATVECQSPAGANVTLDGSASFDPDGDTVYFQWTASGVPLTGSNTATPSGVFPLGQTTVTLTVVDGTNSGATTQVMVTVRDTTAPEISQVTLGPACLWPPNHKLVPYKLGDNVTVSLADQCDASPQIGVATIQSSESPNAKGSGATAPDFMFSADSFCLRSERSGPGGGREYLVDLDAVDASGNRTTVTVSVPVTQTQCKALPNSVFVTEADPRCAP